MKARRSHAKTSRFRKRRGTFRKKSRGSFAKRVKSIVLRQEETKKSLYSWSQAIAANGTTSALTTIYMVDLQWQPIADIVAQIPTGGGYGVTHMVHIVSQKLKMVFTNQTGIASGSNFTGQSRLYIDVISSPFIPSDLGFAGGVATNTLTQIATAFSDVDLAVFVPSNQGQMLYDSNKCTVKLRRHYDLVGRFAAEALVKDITLKLSGPRKQQWLQTTATPTSKRQLYMLYSITTGSPGTASSVAGVTYNVVETKYKTA